MTSRSDSGGPADTPDHASSAPMVLMALRPLDAGRGNHRRASLLGAASSRTYCWKGTAVVLAAATFFKSIPTSRKGRVGGSSRVLRRLQCLFGRPSSSCSTLPRSGSSSGRSARRRHPPECSPVSWSPHFVAPSVSSLGGLGAFEAASVLTLKVAGVSLAATLLFRGLSFWLPMVPGLVFSRGTGTAKSAPTAPSSAMAREPTRRPAR
jgi:hypothetical protein